MEQQELEALQTVAEEQELQEHEQKELEEQMESIGEDLPPDDAEVCLLYTSAAAEE